MIHLDVRDRVATLLLDRPPVNAFDMAQLDRLEQALDAIRGAGDVAVAVVRGAGRHFPGRLTTPASRCPKCAPGCCPLVAAPSASPASPAAGARCGSC